MKPAHTAVLMGAAAIMAIMAATAAPSFADTRACAGDKALYCHSVDQGEGRIYKCLQKNRTKLTDDCGALVDAVAETLEGAKGQCTEDAYTYCTDTTVGVGETMAESDSGQLMQTGSGRVLKCLNDHRDKIAPACAVQVDALMQTLQQRTK